MKEKHLTPDYNKINIIAHHTNQNQYNSFPAELVTTLVSIVKKKYNMAIGNLIGSDLFNMLGVIGVAGIVGKGIQIPAVAHISLYSNSQSYGYSVFFEKFLETGAVGRNYIGSD